MLKRPAAHSGHHAGIALHSPDGRQEPTILRNVETVIVDEIHAVADDKRGAHLRCRWSGWKP